MASERAILDSARRPLVGASMAVWKDGRVLLAQRAGAPFAGVWTFPGGTVEAGETVEMAVIREVAEETGIEARSLGLATHLDVIGRDLSGDLTHHFVVLVFAGLHVSGEARPLDGTASVEWIMPENLGDRMTTEGLAEALAAAQDIYRAHLGG